jgi:hypothetical protein
MRVRLIHAYGNSTGPLSVSAGYDGTLLHPARSNPKMSKWAGIVGVLLIGGCAGTRSVEEPRAEAAGHVVASTPRPAPGAGAASAENTATSGGVQIRLYIPPRPACAELPPDSAQVLLAAGHVYLDRDRNGVACDQ